MFINICDNCQSEDWDRIFGSEQTHKGKLLTKHHLTSQPTPIPTSTKSQSSPRQSVTLQTLGTSAVASRDSSPQPSTQSLPKGTYTHEHYTVHYTMCN